MPDSLVTRPEMEPPGASVTMPTLAPSAVGVTGSAVAWSALSLNHSVASESPVSGSEPLKTSFTGAVAPMRNAPLRSVESWPT